ncbi:MULTISPECIES: hypothetical protein [Burkholderia]|uniref:hypothetical protein n=1 Tax=Burkholderia TaxID=32008 RepID=UPI001583C0BB|nr:MULTISPECIES: hypothetical protein [Burkholderia]
MIDGIRSTLSHWRRSFAIPRAISLTQKVSSITTVKQRLAAICHLFDWRVTGHVVSCNPVAPMKGPNYTTKQGKMTVLDATEAGQLLDSVDVRMPIGLRDRALIALMVLSFTQIGAALTMRVDDVYVRQH